MPICHPCHSSLPSVPNRPPWHYLSAPTQELLGQSAILSGVGWGGGARPWHWCLRSDKQLMVLPLPQGVVVVPSSVAPKKKKERNKDKKKKRKKEKWCAKSGSQSLRLFKYRFLLFFFFFFNSFF